MNDVLKSNHGAGASNKGGGMKKIYSITGGILLALAVVFTGNAAENGTGGPGPANGKALEMAEGEGVDQDDVAVGRIDGGQDKRLINPKMNYRERMEMQRAIQKRAAANRNALIQAEREKQRKQANQQPK